MTLREALLFAAAAAWVPLWLWLFWSSPWLLVAIPLVVGPPVFIGAWWWMHTWRFPR